MLWICFCATREMDQTRRASNERRKMDQNSVKDFLKHRAKHDKNKNSTNVDAAAILQQVDLARVSSSSGGSYSNIHFLTFVHRLELLFILFVIL